MSQTQSSCRAWCCGCCRRAGRNVTGVVVVQLSVLRLLSSYRAWCCRHCRRVAFSVAIAFVTPRIVSQVLFVGLRAVVAVTMPRVVSVAVVTPCGVEVAVVVSPTRGIEGVASIEQGKYKRGTSRI